MPLVLAILATHVCTAASPSDWRDGQAQMRVPLHIHTGFHPRKDEVVEVSLTELPSGPPRVFAEYELPAYRDDARNVLRFLLPGRTPPYEQLRAAAYFGGGEPEHDARLTQPRVANLIKNGGFEQGLSHWAVPQNRRLTASVTQDAAHAGANVLRIDFDGKSGSIESDEFVVAPGTHLLLTAWVRVTHFHRPKPHIGAPVRVLVEFRDEAGNLTGRIASSWSTARFDDRWRLTQAWGTVPGTARRARAQIRNWWCKSTAFVDDIVVAPYTPPPCEITVGQPERRQAP